MRNIIISFDVLFDYFSYSDDFVNGNVNFTVILINLLRLRPPLKQKMSHPDEITGWVWLIQSDSSARFSFELSGNLN